MRFAYSETKDKTIQENRGISFEMIIEAITYGGLLDDLCHPQEKRSNQRIFVVLVKRYIYIVPYVIRKKDNTYFLKTAYPSRKFTKRYKQERGKHEAHDK